MFWPLVLGKNQTNAMLGFMRHAGIRFVRATAVWWVCAVLITLAAFRVQTYICSYDPAMYLGLAQALLQASWDPAGWAPILYAISPLHTLLLAACIRWLGPFAPYWMNWAFLLAFFAFLGLFMRQVFRRPALTALTLLLALYVLGLGYYDNLRYLLYPFRETPAFCFILGAYWLAARGLAGGRAWAWLASGAALVLATAAREPSVLAASGPLAVILACRSRPWRQRARDAALLLAPLAAALAAWMILSAISGRWATGQFAGWLHETTRGNFAVHFQWMAAQVGRMLATLHGEIGWPGWVLLAAGLWGLRRGAAWLWFVPSAALTLLFYSFYQAYPRYVLSVLIFVVPLLAVGLDQLLQALAAACRSVAPRLSLSAWQAGGGLILAILAGLGIATIPDFPAYSRADVRRFLADVDGVAVPGATLFVEPLNRDLAAAVAGHTAARIGNPAHPAAYAAAGPIHYLRPLDDQGFSQSRIRRARVAAADLLLEQGDLEPVMTAAGTPRRFVLGRGRYQVEAWHPWSATNTAEPLPAPPPGAPVCWIDWRGAPAGEGNTLVLTERGLAVYVWSLATGGGLQPLRVGALPAATGWVLRAESPQPRPGRLFAGWQAPDQPVFFALDQSGRASARAWITPTTAVGPRGVAIQDRIALNLPWPAGNFQGSMEISPVITISAQQPGSLQLQVISKGRVVAEGALPLDRRVARPVLDIPRAGPDPELVLELHVQPPDAHGAQLQLRGLGLRFIPAAASAPGPTPGPVAADPRN